MQKNFKSTQFLQHRNEVEPRIARPCGQACSIAGAHPNYPNKKSIRKLNMRLLASYSSEQLRMET